MLWNQSLISNSLELSLVEAPMGTQPQNIFPAVVGPNVRYSLHKSPPLVPVLSQMNQIHSLHTIF
jgi:hypothetical protein